MTQDDGSSTKAQSYCPDQYSHIEGIGYTATCSVWYSVMKANKGNNYRRKMDLDQQCMMCVGSKVKNKRGRSQSRVLPSFRAKYDPWQAQLLLRYVNRKATLKSKCTHWATRTLAQRFEQRYTWYGVFTNWLPILYTTGSLIHHPCWEKPQMPPKGEEVVQVEEWHPMSLLASWKEL